MIGDSLDADVQGALDMGLDAIFFNTDKVQVEQEIKQVNHLLELKNIYNHEKNISSIIHFKFWFFTIRK
jgi:FMN phosphatase YigB (HAD superfamily)